MRTFETGATRDTDKWEDPEGFLSPLVVQRFTTYMAKHRTQKDGTQRASDNWQRGIPKEAYVKSAWRHFLHWWLEHRGYPSQDGLEDALCGLMFNVMGYLHEHLKMKSEGTSEASRPSDPVSAYNVPCEKGHHQFKASSPDPLAQVCVRCKRAVEPDAR